MNLVAIYLDSDDDDFATDTASGNEGEIWKFLVL